MCIFFWWLHLPFVRSLALFHFFSIDKRQLTQKLHFINVPDTLKDSRKFSTFKIAKPNKQEKKTFRRLGHVILEVLGHPEALELLDADDLQQLLVADGELLVLRILQFILLDVGPHLLDDLVSRGLLGSDDRCKVLRQGQTLCESTPSAALSFFLGLIRSWSCSGSGVGIWSGGLSFSASACSPAATTAATAALGSSPFFA